MVLFNDTIEQSMLGQQSEKSIPCSSSFAVSISTYISKLELIADDAVLGATNLMMLIWSMTCGDVAKAVKLSAKVRDKQGQLDPGNEIAKALRRRMSLFDYLSQRLTVPQDTSSSRL